MNKQVRKKLEHKSSQIQKPPAESERHINYRSLIASYYDKGAQKEDIQDILKQITPDVEILNSLIQFQKSIDSLVKRKRFDLQEMNIRPDQKILKVLRIHVVNFMEQGSHKLKIKGYIYPRMEVTQDIKLTSFFRQINFKFTNESYNPCVWKKPQQMTSERDGFILNLNSSQRTGLEISMVVLSNPPKFKIDPYLQKIVKMETGTRINILQALWQYIKIHKLQDLENKQTINTDQALKNAFKCEKMQFSTINGRIRELLSPCEPLAINMSLSDKHEQKIFDMVVEIEAKARVEAMPFLAQKSNETNQKTVPENPYFYLNSKIKKLEKTIQDNIEKLRRQALKREVYKNFSREKIEEIVKEQHKLLGELAESQHKDDPNQIDFLFQNQDQVEKEVKNYLEQASLNRGD